MKFVSTRGRAPAVDFRTALRAGLAPDGGLYVPEAIEPLTATDFDDVSVARALIGDEMPREALAGILADALNFPMPLRPLTDRLMALELFHGPTFAFKDVGARVMARFMAFFHAAREPLTVLVATSGDTGSAVAQAFFGVPGTRVVVLFPDGQVSPVQEAQFTTVGGNVTAVAVNGTFDDCQRLAKEAFADADLRERARLTSANSINIGRLIPQTLYYVRASLAAARSERPVPNASIEPTPSNHRRVIFSVPSGNFGNLTAGLFAWRLGAPIGRFVAATTINDTVPRYLESGRYEPRASVRTLANAMDVGDPSNVARIRWLFGEDVSRMRDAIAASVHADAEVRGAIAVLWREHRYAADPHTAIAYLGATRVPADGLVIFLATAHPAKFREVVEPIIGEPVPLPPALQEALARPRQVVRIDARVSSLRRLL